MVSDRLQALSKKLLFLLTASHNPGTELLHSVELLSSKHNQLNVDIMTSDNLLRAWEIEVHVSVPSKMSPWGGREIDFRCTFSNIEIFNSDNTNVPMTRIHSQCTCV